jgi:LysR family glycine cleavage system transcriptional activator
MTFKRQLLPPMNHLLAFEAAARHESISRAAEERHLTQSALSRQIASLEQSLGVDLFHRVRQRIVLTDAGRLYAGELRQALEAMSAATHRIMSLAGAEAVLNIAVLPTFGTRWLIPRLPDFAARHPELTINFAARSEPFDFQKEAFDLAIHFGAPIWPGASCTQLMSEALIPVCSPGFKQAHRLRRRADLAACRLLQQITRPTQWADWFEAAGIEAPQAHQGPHFEQFGMVAEAAVAGLGVALVPRILVEAELADGRLVALDGHHGPVGQAYHLVVPHSRAGNALVREFSAWLVAQAQVETQPR